MKRISQKNYTQLLVFYISFAIIFLSLGYFLGVQKAARKPAVQPIIRNIHASAQGKIVKASANSITVSDGSKEETFSLSDKITINSTNPSATGSAQVSHDPKNIQLNKTAIVFLSFDGKRFLVTALTFLPF